MKKTNACLKNNELTSILNEHFKGKINLARVRLMAHLICALCKVRTVSFEKLGQYLLYNRTYRILPKANTAFRGRLCALDSHLIAHLVFALLPEKQHLTLTIDRTNWKFGQIDINIFMLGIVYKGVAFPLLFTMLDKRGNSNSAERIALVERFIRLFGNSCIACLVADREFVGKKWIGYLNDNAIRYHIRIRNNFKVWMPTKNKELKAFLLFNDLKIGCYKHYDKIVSINGQLCYLSGCRLQKGDFYNYHLLQQTPRG
jgi:hypothetical protein